MASAPTSAASAANGLSMKAEEMDTKVSISETPAVNWDSEVQLVSSLAKLQELERKVSDNV